MNTTIQPIPELDYRSESQKEQIHDWLEELGIRGTMKKLQDEWGLPVTYNKLQRYRKRLLQKEQLAEHLEHEIAMPEYLALLNARPVPYDEAGLALIQKRAYELAHEPKITPAKLATLQRIFNYKTVRADIEHRKQLDERNTIVREKTLGLRAQESARRAASSPSPPSREAARLLSVQTGGERAGVRGAYSQPRSDDLGPFARNLQEIGERVRKHLGITSEEAARRAALRKTWTPPHPQKHPPRDLTPAHENPSPARMADENVGALQVTDVNQSPSPEGTLDNSPAASAPGNPTTSQSVQQGRLNPTGFQPTPNQSNETNDLNQ